jgi:hypothetical protein
MKIEVFKINWTNTWNGGNHSVEDFIVKASEEPGGDRIFIALI